MKKSILLLTVAALFASFSCTEQNPSPDPDQPKVDNSITISSPTPTESISRVTLDRTQQSYVKAGNGMAFRFLEKMYDGSNLILSPLSLQYALGMTANGASGETLKEIIDFLGYGSEGINALNAYCKTMLEQLPAVDLDVALKLTDAILVNNDFPLLESFRNTVQYNYYAAVENMDFADPSKVADIINDWANRNTNGFIDKVLDASEISEDAVAFLMNALYFKAKWAGSEYDPMFTDSSTYDEDFTRADGSKTKIPMMHNLRRHRFAELDGFKVLALPYAGSKFFMYFLLPNDNNLDGLVNKLAATPWESIVSSFRKDADVSVRIPKFEVENKFYLNDALKSLGVKKAFLPGVAEFDGMFQPKEPASAYCIGKVIQKARISVAEWGTEAAAVTIVAMDEATALPGEELKYHTFYADHPFLFVIGEATSGAILFEGAYTGK